MKTKILLLPPKCETNKGKMAKVKNVKQDRQSIPKADESNKVRKTDEEEKTDEWALGSKMENIQIMRTITAFDYLLGELV